MKVERAGSVCSDDAPSSPESMVSSSGEASPLASPQPSPAPPALLTDPYDDQRLFSPAYTAHSPAAYTAHSPAAYTAHSPAAYTAHSPAAYTAHSPAVYTAHSPATYTSHSPSAYTSHSPVFSPSTKGAPPGSDAKQSKSGSVSLSFPPSPVYPGAASPPYGGPGYGFSPPPGVGGVSSGGGFPPELSEEFGCQAEFVQAVREGNTRELKRILTRYSQLVQINGFTSDGQTALTQSCLDGNLEVIKVLVAHGASLHLANRDGFSPIHLACWCGNMNVMNYLLTSSASNGTSRR